MKHKKTIFIICFAIAICIILAGIAFAFFGEAGSVSNNFENISHETTVSFYTNDEMSSMVSKMLADKSLEQTSSYVEDEFMLAFQAYELKYPFTTVEEGASLTLGQIDENIAGLQSAYLRYLEHCNSEYLRAWAENKYEYNMNKLNRARAEKTVTPEDKQSSMETAFYYAYEKTVKECKEPEVYGLTSEQAAEMLDIAERAKRHYESGKITIEQACQAIRLTGGYTSYDETFSLPE